MGGNGQPAALQAGLAAACWGHGLSALDEGRKLCQGTLLRITPFRIRDLGTISPMH